MPEEVRFARWEAGRRFRELNERVRRLGPEGRNRGGDNGHERARRREGRESRCGRELEGGNREPGRVLTVPVSPIPPGNVDRGLHQARV